MGRSLLNNEDKDFVSRRPRISSDSCLVSQIVVQCHVEVNNVRIDAIVGHENVALFQQTKANIKKHFGVTVTITSVPGFSLKILEVFHRKTITINVT